MSPISNRSWLISEAVKGVDTDQCVDAGGWEIERSGIGLHRTDLVGEAGGGNSFFILSCRDPQVDCDDIA